MDLFHDAYINYLAAPFSHKVLYGISFVIYAVAALVYGSRFAKTTARWIRGEDTPKNGERS